MSTVQTSLHENRLSRLTESDWVSGPIAPAPKPVHPKPHWIKGQDFADQLACFAMLLDVSKRQSEEDAKRTIFASLESIVLLWWRVEVRKPNVSPLPANCPKKLFDHGCLRKAELHDLQVAFKPAATATHLFQAADSCLKTMELQFQDLLGGGLSQ
ncbi:hypothetical protein CA51_11120 [Rosistilla oblonga]|uniref:hypothetical protein n=1 Tax=Rosistilla oblonga TaxID=2527990 RepID=UPI001188F8B0|nr:hypothetical protein [Rosistilla oblonga]QDV11251.1 hypothetical protein CA51_11120 [Rosistilla oblonga]